MTVGSPGAASRVAPGLKFVCLTDKNTRFPELDNFPTGQCRGGIMTVHHFPSSVVSFSLSLYSLTDLRLDVGTARPSIPLTTNLTCTAQSGKRLIMPVLAHPHTLSACHNWPMRLCGIRHSLTTCGQQTARNPLS